MSKVTHEQIGRKIGVSRAQVSRLENGHVVDPHADSLDLLTHAATTLPDQ